MKISITMEHVNLFKDCGGDYDGLQRTGRLNDGNIDKVWFKIADIVQNLTIIKNGLASENFKAQALNELEDSCENDEVQKALVELSKANSSFCK